MYKFSLIVGRAGFAPQLAGKLVSNVDVEAYVEDEAAALAVGKECLGNVNGWDGGPITLIDESLDIYPIEIFKDNEATVIGWEIEGYGGTDLYYDEDEDN